MAIGHIVSHTTSHAESEEMWDASTNKGLLFSTKDHFVQKNVSWGLFFSTLKSCRPSPEEKIKINRDALSVLRPIALAERIIKDHLKEKNLLIDSDGEVEDTEEEEETMEEEEEELTMRGGINPLR
ncbi:hypothetical protein V1478_005154 [Vespula squamosa]|uniref:Uncharacterized protein n=1 Tax=Vespula squamosa TaxID=30214 RepID=A0ABD2BDC0_VESSQ